MRAVITGDKQVERMLRGMQDRDADKIALASLRAGASTGAREVRKAAPVGPTKNLKGSIGSRIVRIKRKGIVQAKFGINVGKRSKKVVATRGKTHRAPHGHLVALGTKERTRTRLGGKFAHITNPTQQQLRTGRNTANPFVKQATASSRAKVSAAMVRKARERVARYNQRKRP